MASTNDRLDELTHEVRQLRWSLYVFAAGSVSVISGLALLLLTR